MTGSWYCRTDEVVAVSNLQKSQYGAQYYFNQSFWLTQCGDERFPKEHKCHIRARFEALFPDEATKIRGLLDLDQPILDGRRIDDLVAVLAQRLLPLITEGQSISGLRGLFDRGAFKAAGISGCAQEALRRTDGEG